MSAVNLKRHVVAILIGIALVGVAALLVREAARLRELQSPTEPSFTVPASFRGARQADGHRRHLAADVPCRACHEEGFPADGSRAVIRDGVCGECHAQIPTDIPSLPLAEAEFLHANSENASAPDCVGCHDFRALDPFQPQECQRCHTGDASQGPSISRHAEESCTNCHHPHRETPTDPLACLNCHADRATGHREAMAGQPAQCLTCHGAHADEPPPAERCATCHAETRPQVNASAALFRGHDACVNCHSGHDVRAETVAECRSCHQELTTLAADEAPAHRRCASCHAPHAPRSAPGSRCASCHEDVHSDHPEPADSCTTCHAPHGTREPGMGTPAHHVGVERVPCVSCHEVQGQIVDHMGNDTCEGCHQPHDFVFADVRQTCAGCHGAEVRAADTLAGHQRCADCHGGSVHHQPAPNAATCSQCHAAVARTAPPGHSRCVDCHQTHTGQLLAGARTCSNCHQAQAAGGHGGDQLECATCHRPHGPMQPETPPPCATCHVPAELPAMHGITEHRQQCSDCHDTHGVVPPGARSACASCHEGMENHIREANVCNGCHTFSSVAGPRVRMPER